MTSWKIVITNFREKYGNRHHCSSAKSKLMKDVCKKLKNLPVWIIKVTILKILKSDSVGEENLWFNETHTKERKIISTRAKTTCQAKNITAFLGSKFALGKIDHLGQIIMIVVKPKRILIILKLFTSTLSEGIR